MNAILLKFISRLLVVCMLGIPYQYANAGMVGTDQALAVAQAQTQPDRERVRDFVSRADVAQQLQALGIQPDAAKQRVSAMTDEEVRKIAGHLDSLPAAGTDGWAIIGVVAVVALIVWFFYAYK